MIFARRWLAARSLPMISAGSLRGACRFWEARCPELPRACRFALRATRAQPIAQARRAAGGSRAPLGFRHPRTFLAPA
jgi:hypothetical protein